jgi:hypothetical protein
VVLGSRPQGAAFFRGGGRQNLSQTQQHIGFGLAHCLCGAWSARFGVCGVIWPGDGVLQAPLWLRRLPSSRPSLPCFIL